MLLNNLVDKLEGIGKSISSSYIKVFVNNVLKIKSIDLSLDNFNRRYVNIVTSDSNKAILDKVANYLRNNIERYDESIGLTKEEFIEDLIKNVTK